LNKQTLRLAGAFASGCFKLLQLLTQNNWSLAQLYEIDDIVIVNKLSFTYNPCLCMWYL